jgi:hypothetical protein
MPLELVETAEPHRQISSPLDMGRADRGGWPPDAAIASLAAMDIQPMQEQGGGMTDPLGAFLHYFETVWCCHDFSNHSLEDSRGCCVIGRRRRVRM